MKGHPAKPLGKPAGRMTKYSQGFIALRFTVQGSEFDNLAVYACEKTDHRHVLERLQFLSNKCSSLGDKPLHLGLLHIPTCL